jgi:hypothetical protein
MVATSPLIVRVTTPEYKKVIIEASNGFRYCADLSMFESVYCFPRTETDWDRVAADSYGSALVWATRFEVHVDQIIALAYKTEPVTKTA